MLLQGLPGVGKYFNQRLVHTKGHAKRAAADSGHNGAEAHQGAFEGQKDIFRNMAF